MNALLLNLQTLTWNYFRVFELDPHLILILTLVLYYDLYIKLIKYSVKQYKCKIRLTGVSA